ncbi:MAG: hypothetical protein GY811_30310 [Myxococcales bacterium]|nr:hypothetical protein [Myxococcales bacterium]
MIASDPELVWLDRRHLQNWWELAIPPGISGESRYGLLVLGEGKLIAAIRSGDGALPLEDVPFEGTGKAQLARLSNKMQVEGLVVFERRALTDLFENMERDLRIEDDLATQGVGLWQALRRSEGIWSDPPLLELIPPLRSDALQKTFDLLVPNETTLVAYVMHERRVHCSVIAEKCRGSIVLATMHPGIGDLLSEQELCQDWRERYDRVNRAVESRFCKPSISVFVERDAVDRILRGPTDQLAKELRSGNLIVDPSPLWLQGLLGGAAALAAATTSAKRMARFLPKGARKMAGDIAQAAGDRVKESGASPFGMLGFDPIELLVRLRSFYAD